MLNDTIARIRQDYLSDTHAPAPTLGALHEVLLQDPDPNAEAIATVLGRFVKVKKSIFEMCSCFLEKNYYP